MSGATAAPAAPSENGGHGGAPAGRDLAKMSLGALGVVYGDIGTSPLYAMRECFHGEHAVPVTPDNVYGVLSLIFWALMLVIVLKYLSFIMQADNRGEGGILALCALVMTPTDGSRRRRAGLIVLAGLFGAGLLYGDGVITPAISILGAMEGLTVAAHKLTPLVVPVSAAILLGLFVVQRFGTGRIGAVFGWVVLAWFIGIGTAGAISIAHGGPGILRALSPTYAILFFARGGMRAFLVLGAVVLVVTGGEALYADMGHFGRKPIRLAWYTVVLPGLLLNYFGQGSLLLRTPQAVSNPFYALAPGLWLYPMMVLATLAAIIASQALISGAFSLTRGAVQLGYFPRVRVIHTSGETEGQIYIPEVNWMLMAGCLALVFGFESSSNLASAYGIAVTGTMAITSVLFYSVAVHRFGWRPLTTAGLVAFFLVVDLSLFSANTQKIVQGGWFPLAVAGAVFLVMVTWRRGRQELGARFRDAMLPDELFLADIEANPPHRVNGTAVFMTSLSNGVPPVLLHHVKHNQVLHKQVVLLSITTEQVPEVPERTNFEVLEMGQGFYRVKARYGFMQTPNVPKLLARCSASGSGLKVVPDQTSYYLGRETLLVGGQSKMARWRKALFAFLARNSRPATAFFHLPPNRVVELGAQIEL